MLAQGFDFAEIVARFRAPLTEFEWDNFKQELVAIASDQAFELHRKCKEIEANVIAQRRSNWTEQRLIV